MPWYVAAERQRRNACFWTAALRVHSVGSEAAWATSSTHCFGRKLHLHAAVAVKGVSSRLWEEVAVSRLKLTALNGPLFALFSECLVRVSVKAHVNSTSCRHRTVGASKGYLLRVNILILCNQTWNIRVKTTYFLPLNTVNFICKQHLQHWQHCVKPKKDKKSNKIYSNYTFLGATNFSSVQNTLLIPEGDSLYVVAF